MARQVGVRETDGERIFEDGSLKDYDPNTSRGLFAFGCGTPDKLQVSCTCAACRKHVPIGAERWFDNKLPRQHRKPLCTDCKNTSKEHKLKAYKEADKDGLTPEYWEKMTAANFEALKRYHAWREEHERNTETQ